MKKILIDMEHNPRRDHFNYFKNFYDPSVGMTVQCDITPLADRRPFFLHLFYCATWAANSVPELRRRIIGDQVVEYDFCAGSHTVALPDETYCYCELECDKPLSEFLPYANERVAYVKAHPSIEEHEPERLFFISSAPWVSFSGLKLPVANPPHTNPQITFGKAYWQGDKYLLPVSLTVHHALCDGLHMAKFFEAFEEKCHTLLQEEC